VLPLGSMVAAVGVGDQPQVGDGLAQPRWVQPPRRIHQHRLGLSREVIGQVGPYPDDGHPIPLNPDT
jgi:hypothetical protein